MPQPPLLPSRMIDNIVQSLQKGSKNPVFYVQMDCFRKKGPNSCFFKISIFYFDILEV